MSEITIGMHVIRNVAASKPVIGVVQSFLPQSMYSRRTKPAVRVHWLEATQRWNGGTDTHSKIAVDSLIEATEENIAKMVARSQALTPTMKAALTWWHDTYGDRYVEFHGASDPLRVDRKKQRTYERAFDKLRNLGYLEGSPENKGRPGAYSTYRIAQKED